MTDSLQRKLVNELNLGDSFCIHPWISLLVNTDGQINCCCVATSNIISNDVLPPTGYNNWDEAGLDGIRHPYWVSHLKNSTLDKVWNSIDMRALRKRMLTGKKTSGCSTCYNEEKYGKISYRQRFNEEWMFELGQEKFKDLISDNDGYAKEPPKHLDLRLGNTCNLKCRSCNPHSSDQIAKEHFTFYKKEKYKIWYDTNHGHHEAVEWMDKKEYEGAIIPDLFERDELWNDIYEWLPNMKKIYFTGGEPLLIKKNLDFLNDCIDLGYAKNIFLFINTNCTIFNKQFENILSEFRHVGINPSIDGYGKTNDYIRSNSKWSVIEKNLIKYIKIPKVQSLINPVYQIYNLNKLHELFLYVIELSLTFKKHVAFDPIINYHQKFLDIRNLPIELRQYAIENMQLVLNKYKEGLHFDGSRVIVSKTMEIELLNGVIAFLKEPQLPDWKQNLKDFVMLTELYDNTRNQSFDDIDKKLYTEIKKLANG